MLRYSPVVRGIPLWLLPEYLQELGGKVEADALEKLRPALEKKFLRGG